MQQENAYDERGLLGQIANGDQTAFAALVNLHKNNIYTSAVRILHSTHLAEEVVQDIFLVVWTKREELPDIDNFSGYLYGITKRTIYNALRKLIREREKNMEHLRSVNDFFHTDTELSLLDKQYSTILQKAIDQLPEKQKKTYLLVRMQGLKREEAATLLNVSPETVKSNLDEAVQKIRTHCDLYLKEITACSLLLMELMVIDEFHRL